MTECGMGLPKYKDEKTNHGTRIKIPIIKGLYKDLRSLASITAKIAAAQNIPSILVKTKRDEAMAANTYSYWMRVHTGHIP